MSRRDPYALPGRAWLGRLVAPVSAPVLARFGVRPTMNGSDDRRHLAETSMAIL
jgi:hypothetical protein